MICVRLLNWPVVRVPVGYEDTVLGDGAMVTAGKVEQEAKKHITRVACLVCNGYCTAHQLQSIVVTQCCKPITVQCTAGGAVRHIQCTAGSAVRHIQCTAGSVVGHIQLQQVVL